MRNISSPKQEVIAHVLSHSMSRLRVVGKGYKRKNETGLDFAFWFSSKVRTLFGEAFWRLDFAGADDGKVGCSRAQVG